MFNKVTTINMSEHQIHNIAVDTELDFTYFANNKHNNNYVRNIKKHHSYITH